MYQLYHFCCCLFLRVLHYVYSFFAVQSRDCCCHSTADGWWWLQQQAAAIVVVLFDATVLVVVVTGSDGGDSKPKSNSNQHQNAAKHKKIQIQMSMAAESEENAQRTSNQVISWCHASSLAKNFRREPQPEIRKFNEFIRSQNTLAVIPQTIFSNSSPNSCFENLNSFYFFFR